MVPTNPLAVIITTVGSMDDAKNLSMTLVENQLVACVQLSKIESIYSWNDEIQQDSEIRLMIKTLPEHLSQTLDYLNDHHPYDTPELISTEFSSNESYIQWCQSVTL